ncbi:hypothetical protein HETIRDRAFT_105110, partial [Heterobasidion irregulare TC 32-1]
MDNSAHYDPLAFSQYSPHRPLDSAISLSSWHHHQHSPTSASSPPDQSRMYPIINNPINHIDYTSPQFVHQPPSAFLPQHDDDPSLNPSHALNLDAPQLQSSIGPTRVLTRRQRAAQAHPHPARPGPVNDLGLSGENHD